MRQLLRKAMRRSLHWIEFPWLWSMKPRPGRRSSNMFNGYRYVRIEEGLYVCLQQNLLVLPWLIYLKGKALGFSLKNLREAFGSFKRLLRWMKRLSRYVLPICTKPPTLRLPFYGHLCLEVHRGYKVFDLYRETVTKIFRPEVSISTVTMEIERARTAGLYDFAPRLRRWDVEARWYEEEYVNGEAVITYTNGYPVTSLDSTNFLDTYYQYLEPCIKNLILSQPPKSIDVNEYVGGLQNTISEKIQKSCHNTNECARIDQFVSLVARELDKYKSNQVYIAYSHGDFSHGHAIKTNYGIKVIDWEYLSSRSILFDLYSCLLEQLFFKRVVHDLVKQVDNAISRLQIGLTITSPTIADHLLSTAQIYRWIFYLEQVCSGTEFLDYNTKAKLTWIDAFTKFEEMQGR